MASDGCTDRDIADYCLVLHDGEAVFWGLLDVAHQHLGISFDLSGDGGHGVANFRELQAKTLADAGSKQDTPRETFKDYEPSFVYVDIKYLPQMPDGQRRRYLFVVIDRATRWLFMHIYVDQSEDSSVDLLNRLERAAPMKIVKLLTDNGSQFTDRFTCKTRESSGQRKFDMRCKVLKQTCFASVTQWDAPLMSYVKTCNDATYARSCDPRDGLAGPVLKEAEVVQETGL